LNAHPGEKVTVFAVWEPILPTDWTPPTTGALSRLADGRVRQFWDEKHLLAKFMADSRAHDSQPDCCNRNGTLWDLIAVYPPGTEWSATLPTATIFNGPIIRVMGSAKIL
jgi:hypothetical protein